MFGNLKTLQRSTDLLHMSFCYIKQAFQPQPPTWVSFWTPLPPTIIIMADKGFLLTNIIVVSKTVSTIVLMQDELFHFKLHLLRCVEVQL